MFVVAGVSGHTGSVVAETLLDQRKPVRVLVRTEEKAAPWRARGAEAAVASLSDTAALSRALAGAQGAYLLLPPDLRMEKPLEQYKALASSIAAAVQAANVQHVVLLSSIGAQHPSGTGPILELHNAEEILRSTGCAVTALRPAYFMENWASALGMVGQGVLPTFLPASLSFAQVATRDIGRTAAAALVEGPSGSSVIELAGPREYSADDVAAAVSSIVGKSVKAAQGPLDRVVPTLTGFGFSNAVAGLFREMYEGIASGRVGYEKAPQNRSVRGTVPLEDVLRPMLGK